MSKAARSIKRKIETRSGSVSAAIVAARAVEQGSAWHTITLPKPPSLNNLYPDKKNVGGRTTSKRGKQWKRDASYIILASRPPRIVAEYELRIELGRYKGSDLFNYEKALSDLLKDTGVIRDDSLCERGVIEWADDLASNEARFSIRAVARTIAVKAPAKRKRQLNAADVADKSERLSAAAYRDLCAQSGVSRRKSKAKLR